MSERVSRPGERLGRWLLPVAAGLLVYAAFPPQRLPVLAWVALVPLLVSLGAGSGPAAAAKGALFGLAFLGPLLRWFSVFGPLAWIGILLVTVPWMVLFALLARPLVRRGGFAHVSGTAGLWVGIEWLRAQTAYGFPWGQLGVSQAPLPAALQPAALGGVWLVSLLVMLANTALAELALSRLKPLSRPTAADEGAASRRSTAAAGAALLLVAAAWAGGLRRVSAGLPAGVDPIDVGVVQASTRGQDGIERLSDLEIFRIHADLTRSAASQGADLIVWPETAVPAPLAEDPEMRRATIALNQITGRPLVAGTTAGWTRGGAAYNSVLVFAPDGSPGARYDKVQLVPFGEFLPGRRFWPWLTQLGVPEVDMLRAAEVRPLPVPLAARGADRTPRAVLLGPMICFESTFPRIARSQALQGAEVLLAVTVDSWYGRSAAAEQHAAFSALRAVETGRYLVRASATGISMVLDPLGRELGRIGLFERDARVYRVFPQGGRTPYTRFGDWVPALCLLAFLAGLPRPAALRGRRAAG